MPKWLVGFIFVIITIGLLFPLPYGYCTTLYFGFIPGAFGYWVMATIAAVVFIIYLAYSYDPFRGIDEQKLLGKEND